MKGDCRMKEKDKNENSEYSYKVMMDGLQKSRAWSVAAIAVAIVSVVCCCLPWFGLVSGILAVVFSVVSRKTIGYFDNLAIAGLIVGIFGIVFGVSNMVLNYLIENTEFLSEFLAEYEALLEQYGAEAGTGPDL